MANGKIKGENRIEIEELNITDLDLFEKQLISTLDLRALVSNIDGQKIRIIIHVKSIYSSHGGRNTVESAGNIARSDKKQFIIDSSAMRRAELWFFNSILKKEWIITGKIGKGNDEIVIVYFEDIQYAAYSLKTLEEKTGTVFQDPKMN